jgi:hypothetical protein
MLPPDSGAGARRRIDKSLISALARPESSDLIGEETGKPVNKHDHYGHPPRPAVRRRDWRRIHHSPWFWVGVVLFLAAITIYVLSDDLSWRPRVQ